jgi:hypothetical protein
MDMLRWKKQLLPTKVVKIILWALIAIYTYLLPQARLVYNWIVAWYGDETAGKVPLVLVLVVACVFIFAVLRGKKDWKRLLYLVPGGIISYLIMILVENPNKHIHIPQYVIMVWLLYAVLSMDYQSKDLLFIIFIYASLLGVVDELEQGLHPTRFYGWIDMAVNSSSSLIGVFTVMGLRTLEPADWSWTRHLKDMKLLLWDAVFGIAGAVYMCVVLFQVQAGGEFRGVYPAWLLAWNALFLVLTLLVLAVYYFRKTKKGNEKAGSLSPAVKKAALWTIPLLVILFYMHSLIVYLSITGIEFA